LRAGEAPQPIRISDRCEKEGGKMVAKVKAENERILRKAGGLVGATSWLGARWIG
jgi:hypothetical protein